MCVCCPPAFLLPFHHGTSIPAVSAPGVSLLLWNSPLAPIRTQLLSKSPFSSLSCGLPPTHMGYLRRSSGLRNLSFARDVGILKGALEV